MDKYYAFKKMLEFMATHAKVVDADMNCYNGSMRIEGENDGHTIRIEVTIKDKEEKKDA